MLFSLPLLLSLVITGTGAAPSPLAVASRLRAALGDSPPPPPLDCATCELVMGVYEEIAGNATTLREFVALFEEACTVIAPGVPVLTALCDAVVSGLIEGIVPFLDKELKTLAWDIPETFCAVFIPVCTIPCCAAPTAPEQRRLAWTNDLNAVSVQWTTLQLAAGSGAQFFPVAAGGPPLFVPAAPRTYTLGGWVGTLYSTAMAGLSPGAAYTYRVGSDAGGWSAWENFTALPSDVGTDSRPLRLVHIGDMGWGDNSNETIAAVEALAAAGSIDGVLHSGDVSYADGQQKSWDVFGRKIEGISSRIPYMVGVGNQCVCGPPHPTPPPHTHIRTLSRARTLSGHCALTPPPPSPPPLPPPLPSAQRASVVGRRALPRALDHAPRAKRHLGCAAGTCARREPLLLLPASGAGALFRDDRHRVRF